jgi:hypothetical protein
VDSSLETATTRGGAAGHRAPRRSGPRSSSVLVPRAGFTAVNFLSVGGSGKDCRGLLTRARPLDRFRAVREDARTRCRRGDASPRPCHPDPLRGRIRSAITGGVHQQGSPCGRRRTPRSAAQAAHRSVGLSDGSGPKGRSRPGPASAPPHTVPAARGGRVVPDQGDAGESRSEVTRTRVRARPARPPGTPQTAPAPGAAGPRPSRRGRGAGDRGRDRRGGRDPLCPSRCRHPAALGHAALRPGRAGGRPGRRAACARTRAFMVP